MKVIGITPEYSAFANSYLLVDEDTLEAVYIDPGCFLENAMNAVKNSGAKVKYILMTHGHFDHIMGIPELKELSGAKVGCYEKEAAICSDPHLNLSVSFGTNFGIKPDITYKDGDIYLDEVLGEDKLKTILPLFVKE